MDYKVLYRKYRPTDFDNIVGQDYVVHMLKNSVAQKKLSHAYIFTGPRGTGKTSAAKVFAKAINCLNPIDGNPCNECEHCLNFKDSPDIIEIDAASNNGVDEIRELINNVKLAPTSYKYKVYIIDEVHMLSTSAFNALLLTLEEPPGHVVFVLATTDIQNVPVTILSRCQRFDFRRIAEQPLFDRLKMVCEVENIDIDDNALSEIVILSEGGLRDALGILDQLSTSVTGKITIDHVISNFGTVSTEAIDSLVQSILNNNIDEIVRKIDEFKNSSLDYKVIVGKLMQSLEKYAISSKKNAKSVSLDFISLKRLIFGLNNCISDVKLNVNPYILIELAILDVIKLPDSSTFFEPVISTIEKTKSLKEAPKVAAKSLEIEKEESITDVSQEEVSVEQEPNQGVCQEEPQIEEKPIKEGNVPNDDRLNDLVKIRLNNCFCGAKKQLLQEYKNLWPELITYCETSNKEFMNYLFDTEVMAASEDYLILGNKLESIVTLLNQRLEEMEHILLDGVHKKVKVAVLTLDEWKQAKDTYVLNIKNNVVYRLMDEPEMDHNKETEESELEKLASEIFSEEQIVIE